MVSMDKREDVFSAFHPLVKDWFLSRYGSPTDVQRRAWPFIAGGNHCLITAPTGSGKTLTAFLYAVNQIITGAWPRGNVRVLYVSPLKALNNDIGRNLMDPLDELSREFRSAGCAFPEIGVMTRSGDTAQDERRRMLRKPPEILITTPESLNILLTSKKGRGLFTGIATVILDEIHALAGTKRGTHLITAVDRLVPLTGEFQRIALSATVKPLGRIAEFIGGYRVAGDCHYEKRPVTIIEAANEKEYQVRVSFPGEARDHLKGNTWWPALTRAIRGIIMSNESTLVFCNTRRMVEKVTRFINENETREIAYSHHGALSREIRLVVEQRMKRGELKAIAATGTLELGIDIGKCDQVVLVQTPNTVSSALQKVGRSGHGIGRVSIGTFLPIHGRDFISAAVMARAVIDGDIEDVRPVENPLDVLAQVLLSMISAEQWDVDNLYTFLLATWPYHNLQRRHFDLVMAMLEGRYAGARLKELKPRISLDRIDNTVSAGEGLRYHLYLSGGTIPDRGYFNLRVKDTKAKIGELDEEFVWERSVGETFTMGTQAWRIDAITHNDVEVIPARSKPGIIPFWKADEVNHDFHFAEKTALFLEEAEFRMGEESWMEHLSEHYRMDQNASLELAEFLQLQKKITGASLPHRHHLVVEYCEDPMRTSKEKQVVLHTLWGGAVNTPFAMALAQAWEEAHDYRMEIFNDNNAVMLILPHEFSAAQLFELVTADTLEKLVHRRLGKSGLFGARFRENAARALLLPRSGFHRRTPLWLNRLKSKQLLDAVSKFEDFPIILETWRSCLNDEFDLENLKMLLDEIGRGEIRMSESYTVQASPFASGLVWRQTNKYMYDDDTPLTSGGSRFRESLIREISAASHLRPLVPQSIVDELTEKLQRTAPGYSPGNARELVDWVKERLLIPRHEWDILVQAIKRDHGIEEGTLFEDIASRVIRVTLPGAAEISVCAVESVPVLAKAFNFSLDDAVFTDLLTGNECRDTVATALGRITGHGHEKISPDEAGPDTDDLLRQWISFYGPLDREYITRYTGLDESVLNLSLSRLLDDEEIVIDFLREKTVSEEVCCRDNLEMLLRIIRRSRKVEFQARDAEDLQEFLFRFQRFGAGNGSLDGLTLVLDRLLGYPAPAAAWEEYILPARLEPYFCSWLDSLMQTSDLCWYGCGREKLTFTFNEDLELLRGEASPAVNEDNAAVLMPDRRGRYAFFDIVKHAGGASQDVARRLWDLAWQGAAANDTFETVRKGLLNGFEAVNYSREASRPRRGDFNRWKSSRPLPGNWYAFETPHGDYDAMELAELGKERVRLLLRRYGILFRELLERELPVLQWGPVFRTLRIMELSGEIVPGYFFTGIPGLQFMSHEGFRFLTGDDCGESIYWLNAADPASLCGIKLEGIKEPFPPRMRSTFLVFRGKKMIMILKRNGREVEIKCPDDDPLLQQYLAIFRVLMERDFNPVKKMSVELINGVKAVESAYRESFRRFGFMDDGITLTLRRKY